LRSFTHNDEQWTVEYGGGGVGVASVGEGGALPAITSHLVFFRKTDGTEKVGWLRTKDVNEVADSQLRHVLDLALAGHWK